MIKSSWLAHILPVYVMPQKGTMLHTYKKHLQKNKPKYKRFNTTTVPPDGIYGLKR